MSRINTNVLSLIGQRVLSQQNNALGKSLGIPLWSAFADHIALAQWH